MATKTVDPTTLVVPSTSAPGLLGTIGITTRGLQDALVVFLGVGMAITGLVLMVSGTKTFKNVASTAVQAGKVAALV